MKPNGSQPSSSPDRIAEPWGSRTPYSPGEEWPERTDMHLAAGCAVDDVERWVPSASILHSNGDALDIAVRSGRIVGVRGRPQDRVNHGRLDPKDLYGWQANHDPDRLTKPLVRRRGVLEETDWETAMSLWVDRTQELLQDRGPSSIGFYTSGQLFLEEYYALGLIAHGGIGTPHVDGNTRLCTATAAAALKTSFGCDGQPGTFADIDHADAIALFGHNIAATQTVTWSRILDRLAGSEPPRILCVDPRRTPVAEAATIHLAPRPGTNVMLVNALIRELIDHDWIDHRYIDDHTVGFDDLATMVEPCTIERAAEVCGLAEHDLREAAQLVGTCDRLMSTVLQGFYQSHQATAAATQVNNLHLIRGMLGRPGCGVMQMNGQPTAQNTREAGADGDLPGFRNWANPDHVAELAQIWNVDPEHIPHHGPPTHLMQMIRYAEQGSIRMLHISATNPAVSLPDLARVRDVLSQERLFVVVQDMFLTETAALADLVLPAAGWGEKTGTFTNADRTVHLSEKAVEPPGEARADLEILLDYARRLDLRDRDDQRLLPWSEAAQVFEAWKACSRGRPCDYSGMTYEALRASGIQWPCTADEPDGTERLYADGGFWAGAEECEAYGRDLVTGAPVEADEYRAYNLQGRAMLRPAPYLEPHEQPSDDFPFHLITGRSLYHFHTRTKTARAPELQAADPEVWVEASAADARENGWTDGDALRIQTPRGTVVASLRITGIRDGVLFLPFHYGYWDCDDDEHERAANELTRTEWDPASKQPLFKTAAARAERADQPAATVGEDAGLSATVLAIAGVHRSESQLAVVLAGVAAGHQDDDEIACVAHDLLTWSEQHLEALSRAAADRGLDLEPHPHILPSSGALLEDLRAVYRCASGVELDWIALAQAAKAEEEAGLADLASRLSSETTRQETWARSKVKELAPQALSAATT